MTKYTNGTKSSESDIDSIKSFPQHSNLSPSKYTKNVLSPETRAYDFSSSQLVSHDSNSSVRGSYIGQPYIDESKKLKVFKDEKEVVQHFELTPLNDKEKCTTSSVYFQNPLTDLFQSSLYVTLVVSHFRFCNVLFNFPQADGNYLVDLTHIHSIFSTLFVTESDENPTLAQRMSMFVHTMYMLNLSVSGPIEVHNEADIESKIQEIVFDKEVECVIFEIKSDDISPPNRVTVNSPLVKVNLVKNFDLKREFDLIWGIFERKEHIFPLLVEDDYEVVALYKCILYNRFGSINSLLMSGSKPHFLAYSCNKSGRPQVIAESNFGH